MPSGNNFWGRAVREESGLRKSKEKGTEEFFILFEIDPRGGRRVR